MSRRTSVIGSRRESPSAKLSRLEPPYGSDLWADLRVTLSLVSQPNTLFMMAVVNLLYEMDCCCRCRRRRFDRHLLCSRLRSLHVVLAPGQLMRINSRTQWIYCGSGLFHSCTRKMEMTRIGGDSRALVSGAYLRNSQPLPPGRQPRDLPGSSDNALYLALCEKIS
jgi:hypothetical protein